MNEKNAYEQKMQARMDAWSADLEKLKAKAAEADAEARIRLNDEIRKVEAKKQAAEAKLKQLKAASDDAWQDLREGFDGASVALKSALESAAARF